MVTVWVQKPTICPIHPSILFSEVFAALICFHAPELSPVLGTFRGFWSSSGNWPSFFGHSKFKSTGSPKTLASYSFLNIVSIHKLTHSCLEKFISLKGGSFGILWADFNFSNPKRSCPYPSYRFQMTEDSANEVLGSDMGTWPNPESGNSEKD